ALERNKSSIDTLLLSLQNYAENLNIAVNFNTHQKQSTAAEVITFIPLDGQQRLTTLFLIYWFVANELKNKDVNKILQRFKYATRTSSREFLQFLTHQENYFEYKEETLTNNIQNHEDFCAKWKKDPTGLSMLYVINQIQKQFEEKNLDAAKVWKQLSKEEIITFDFFELDEFVLTHALDVYMNATGKKLGHFDNFIA